MMDTVIPVENRDVLAAVRGFLRQILESGLVESLFVPLEVGNGTAVPALVTDAGRLALANPLLPVMPINNARAVSALTGKRTPARLGVVLRPCEIRALIELVKLQQANLEDVILIGLDCPGTYDLAEYQASPADQRIQLSDYLVAASQGETLPGPPSLRLACQMCVQPVPGQADIHLHFIGVDTLQGIPVTLKDEGALAAGGFAALKGQRRSKPVETTEPPLQIEERESENGAGQRGSVKTTASVETTGSVKTTAVEKLISTRRQARDRELAAMRARMNANGGIASIFAACIRCHNCMTACPICYCKTCLFRTAAFDHTPEAYLKAASRKGAQRMLSDTLLFQMTRLNHMSTSCVSCGMCSAACPSDIPVGTLFSAIGEQVQAAFGYKPGHDVAEPLPLVAFQADEWTEIGEER